MGKYDLFSNVFSGILKSSGDYLIAKVTEKRGNQVIKTQINGEKRSFVRFPTTETIVETIVHKKKK